MIRHRGGPTDFADGEPAIKPAADNQRRFSRIPFNARVQLTGPHGSVATQLLDISLNGALVTRSGDADIQLGTPLLLELLLSETDAIRIRMHVRVAHSEGDRVGLCCEQIDLDSVTHLRRLVELNLGDPVLLDRELAALG